LEEPPEDRIKQLRKQASRAEQGDRRQREHDDN